MGVWWGTGKDFDLKVEKDAKKKRDKKVKILGKGRVKRYCKEGRRRKKA